MGWQVGKGEEERGQELRCRKAGQKDAKYLAIKVVSRGEKDKKQEIKTQAARDEFEGGVGHLTARGEDGGETVLVIL